MSGRVYLRLKANTAAVNGDSSVANIGGVDVSKLIECDGYSEGCKTAREGGSGRATGTRLYEPITVRKNVDVSSPLLMKALTQNELCEGDFLFFRPNVTTGKQEHFFTVKIAEGRVSEIKRFLPDDAHAGGGTAQDVSAAGKPPQEQVSFVFSTITWTHEVGKTEHQDQWKQQ
jgi:type VI secretion system secreted protein Hcp